jgi:hypothetical protein
MPNVKAEKVSIKCWMLKLDVGTGKVEVKVGKVNVRCWDWRDRC